MTFLHKLASRLARLKDVLAPLSVVALASCELTPAAPLTIEPVARLVVSPPSTMIRVMQSTDLEVVGLTAAGDTAPVALTFAVRGGTGGRVEDVNATRRGRAVGRYRAGETPGRDTVLVTDTSGATTHSFIEVTPVPVAAVVVAPTAATLVAGRTLTLVATTLDSTGSVLTDRGIGWGSNNTATVTVSSAGVVTGVAAGTATVTATSEGKSGSATVSVVNVAVAAVDVTPAVANLNEGQTVQLTATPKDASGNALPGRSVSWTTSAPAVATVSPAGVVTGRGSGAATITATSEGVKGTAAVTVTGAPAGTYYVAPTGSDANPGTAVAPFRTIQRAADLVGPGDVVVVENGVYTDSDGDGAVVRIRRGGTAGALVTFRARSKWQAKLDGRGGATPMGIKFENGAGYVRVEGFEIFDMANPGTGPGGRGSSSGIDVYSGGHNSEIVGNHIHHIGRVCTLLTQDNGQDGIYIQQPNVVVDGNVIHDVGRFAPGEQGCVEHPSWRQLDHGIYLAGGSGTTIRNNLFYNCHRGWAIQVYPGPVTNVQILHNTFALGNPYKSYTYIVLDGTISGVIANNIFYSPQGGRTIDAQRFGGSITVQNNLTNGAAMTIGSAPAGMTLIGNRLNTDALLVDPLNPTIDFRVRSGSPAIDAGMSLPQVLRDFDGRLRPQGGAYDIGAYEF